MPSGTTRTSSSTAISTAPREQRTTNSLGLSKVTFATVGSSPRGLKAAVLACSTKAFSLDVENAADPPSNVALAAPPSPPHTRRLEAVRSEEHTSELQSRRDLVCRLLLEKKKQLKW